MDDIQVGTPYPFSRFTPNRTKFEERIEEFRSHGFNTIELLFLGCSLGIPKPGPILYYPTIDQAESVAKLLNDFSISIHGPYVISLSTTDKQKKTTTKTHFTKNLKLGEALGATHVTFHSGTRKNQADGKRIKKFLKTIVDEKEHNNYKTRLAPEVAGKMGSFSGFRQIIDVAHECGTLFCWDFSHDYVRGGNITTESGILKRLELIEDNIDFRGYRLPIHISGILGGKRGEIAHTIFGEGSGVPWQLFFTVLREQGWLNRVQIICESKVNTKSSNKERLMDAIKIKEFIESDEIVKTHFPPKSRLDAFWS